MKKLFLPFFCARYTRIGLAALLLLSLCACAATPTPPDYRLSGFTCEASWMEEALSLRATITVSPPQAQDTPFGQRDLTISFLSPDSLAGVTVCRRSGEISVQLGDVSLDGASSSSWLRVAELLLPDGALSSISRTQENGRSLLYAEIHTTEDDSGCQLYLEPSTGIPLRIRRGAREVEIHAFTFFS